MNPLKRKKLYRLELKKSQAEAKPAVAEVVKPPEPVVVQTKEEPKLALKETPVVVKEEPKPEVVAAVIAEETVPAPLEQTEPVVAPPEADQQPEVTVVAEQPTPVDTKKKKKQ